MQWQRGRGEGEARGKGAAGMIECRRLSLARSLVFTNLFVSRRSSASYIPRRFQHVAVDVRSFFLLVFFSFSPEAGTTSQPGFFPFPAS